LRKTFHCTEVKSCWEVLLRQTRETSYISPTFHLRDQVSVQNFSRQLLESRSCSRKLETGRKQKLRVMPLRSASWTRRAAVRPTLVFRLISTSRLFIDLTCHPTLLQLSSLHCPQFFCKLGLRRGVPKEQNCHRMGATSAIRFARRGSAMILEVVGLLPRTFQTSLLLPTSRFSLLTLQFFWQEDGPKTR
jgi:hypothetical protein